MSQYNHLADSEESPPIGRYVALELFITHTMRGYAPYMVEQNDGLFIVHRGERLVA